jgi:hypothetical protein
MDSNYIPIKQQLRTENIWKRAELYLSQNYFKLRYDKKGDYYDFKSAGAYEEGIHFELKANGIPLSIGGLRSLLSSRRMKRKLGWK